MRGPIPRFKGHIATVVLCLLAFAAMAFWLLNVGGALPTSADTYEVRALVPSAQSVAAGAQVTVAGAPVGKVSRVQRRGMGAVLTLKLTEKRVTPLRSDATAQIRARTPVGENYVAIVPGHSDAKLREGGQLRVATGEGFVDIDKLLSTLQGRTRERARTFLQGAATGLHGQGDALNTLLSGTSASFREGSTVVHALVNTREQLARFVDGLGEVARAVGERQDAIAATGSRGIVAFRAIAQRDASLRRLLRELPTTLTTVQRTSGSLRATATTATPVVANLATAVREVRPAIRRLKPAATQGRAVVRELDAAAPGLEKALGQVRTLAGPLAPALPWLHKTLCQANPILRYGQPYTADIVQALVGLGSASNAYDAIGHTIRLMPVVNDNSLVGLPDELSKAANALIHQGVLQRSSALDYQPFMKPGDLGHVKAEGKGVVGPDGVREAGFKYPRIHADC